MKITIRLFPSLRLSKVRLWQVISLVLLIVLLSQTTLAFAQTNTPVPPTATPGLTIPTDVIFSETNFWIDIFAPIAAIGIGIGIALAVLGYIGNVIRNAFR